MSIVTIDQIKTVTGLPATVEERKLLPYYGSAERTLRRILGDTVFERIEAAVISGTDTPANELIADYIEGFLAWFTYGRALTRLYAEPDRNGVHYKNDANTIQVDTSWLNDEKKSAGEMRDQFQSDLIAYLDKNSDTGEEWAAYRTDTESANDDLRESARRTFSGVVIPKKMRDQCE